MRIIGGEFGGRRFHPPADKWPTRPTTDFAKEGLYNILQNRIDFEQTRMLDLFGGTGNHCYEFISRGCLDATYVDKFRGCVLFVTKSAELLDITDRLHIHQMDVFKFIDQCADTFDFIFAGPPYPLKALPTIPDKVLNKGLLRHDGIFVLEHNPQHDFQKHPNFTELRNYGTTLFSFFQTSKE